MQFSPVSYYFLHLPSTYFPHNPIFEHPPTKFYTHLKNGQNYISVRFQCSRKIAKQLLAILRASVCLSVFPSIRIEQLGSH